MLIRNEARNHSMRSSGTIQRDHMPSPFDSSEREVMLVACNVPLNVMICCPLLIWLQLTESKRTSPRFSRSVRDLRVNITTVNQERIFLREPFDLVEEGYPLL